MNDPKPFVWGGYTYADYRDYLRSVHVENNLFFLQRMVKDFEEELVGLRKEATEEEVKAALERINRGS